MFLNHKAWLTIAVAATSSASARGEHFRFGSVFIKKNNQTENYNFFYKKTETEPNLLKTDHFQFGSVWFL